MSLSAVAYGALWRFHSQALPEDLAARWVSAGRATRLSHPAEPRCVLSPVLLLWDSHGSTNHLGPPACGCTLLPLSRLLMLSSGNEVACLLTGHKTCPLAPVLQRHARRRGQAVDSGLPLRNRRSGAVARDGGKLAAGLRGGGRMGSPQAPRGTSPRGMYSAIPCGAAATLQRRPPVAWLHFSRKEWPLPSGATGLALVRTQGSAAVPASQLKRPLTPPTTPPPHHHHHPTPQAYFRAYLALYYKSDEEVLADEELQAWWSDAKASKGLAGQGQAGSRHVQHATSGVAVQGAPASGAQRCPNTFTAQEKADAGSPFLLQVRINRRRPTQEPTNALQPAPCTDPAPQDNGHPDMKLMEPDEAKVWGFAGPIPSVEKLTRVLTTIAWTVSRRDGVHWGKGQKSGESQKEG